MTEHVIVWVWGRKDVCTCVWDCWNNNFSSAHTVTHGDSCQFFLSSLVVLLCSLYPEHIRPGPCHWPSKEKLITGKEKNFVCLRFLCLSVSLGALLFSSVFITLPLFFFPLPCLYFLLWVKFENTPLCVFHPQIPSCCSLLWWILKARGSTKVQIRFFRIPLLWIETCPCYLSLYQLLRGAGKGCDKCTCMLMCVFKGVDAIAGCWILK